MKIIPWKASTWNPNKHSNKKHYKLKLICPFCLKSHRTLASAHVCALEVSKYGTIEMRAKMRVFEIDWLNRHPEAKARLDHTI